MPDQNELLSLNLGWLPRSHEAAVLEFEGRWIEDLCSQVALTPAPLHSINAWKTALEDLVSRSQLPPSPHSLFVAQEMSVDQFRTILREYAIDGLTEATAMFAIVPRLRGTAQAAVMRILIDEFGCGNPTRVHAELYRLLLLELGLSDRLRDYLGTVNAESLAFVNLYHYLTKRAPHVAYYVGALVYTEMVIPTSFTSFDAACQRLGIHQRAYFTEHMHIDAYHTADALLALEALAAEATLDLQAAWVGALLAQHTGDRAFEAAVSKARGGA